MARPSPEPLGVATGGFKTGEWAFDLLDLSDRNAWPPVEHFDRWVAFHHTDDDFRGMTSVAQGIFYQIRYRTA